MKRSTMRVCRTRWGAFALAVLVGACGGGSGDGAAGSAGSGGDSTPLPAEALTRSTIGAAGGALTSPDGRMVLTVPAGALAAATEITISEPAAADLPQAVQAVHADKVYRLEPSGLAFVQPVTVRVDLEAGASRPLAVLVVHGAGRWEGAAAQTLTLSADRRRLSGQLNHFSELAVKTVEGASLTARVDPVEIAVGESLVGEMTAGKTAVPWSIELALPDEPPFVFRITPGEGAPMQFLGSEGDELGRRSLVLEAGAARTVATRWTYRCLAPHSENMRFGPLDVFVPGDLVSAALFLGTVELSTQVVLERPYVCKAAATPQPGADAVRVGLFPLPLNLRQAEALHVVPGPFAGLPGGTQHAIIGGDNGALAIDLKTGAVTLDQTASGAEGRLGAAPLLDALPVSQPNPGAAVQAGLFGASATGGALRSYVRFNDGSHGWSQTLLLGPVLDFGTAGGGLVSDEVLGVLPAAGLVPYRWDGVAYRHSGIGGVGAFHFEGSLLSAALPSSVVGAPVLALSAGTDGGTTSTVWLHTRTNEPAARLATLPGADAKRLRCLREDARALLASRTICGVTRLSGALHLWLHDTANPGAVPVVQMLPVGDGALGLQFDRRADGRPWAVVANFNANTFNVVDFDASGAVAANRTVAVPAGCLNPGHAVPFSRGGKDYVAGTCRGSDHYFVVPVP